MSGFDAKEVADMAARAAIEVWEKRRQAVDVRHYGMKAIVDAVALTAGISPPSPTTVYLWARTKGFPLDKNGIGIFVTQWALERWLNAYEVGVEKKA